MGAKPRVVAYMRVSTEKQAEQGLSLDAQQAKLAAYAALYEVDLAAVSQWERETIGERTAEAMAYKRQQREYTGGEPPYGWRLAADGIHLDPHRAEQGHYR